MRSSMSVDWAVLAARGCLDRDLAIMGVPLHQTPCGRTLRGSQSAPAIFCVQSQTILQCVESIEGILDSLGLAVVTGEKLQKALGIERPVLAGLLRCAMVTCSRRSQTGPLRTIRASFGGFRRTDSRRP